MGTLNYDDDDCFFLITINSGLLPLFEVYALKILIIKDLRLSVVCVHIICLSFLEDQIC